MRQLVLAAVVLGFGPSLSVETLNSVGALPAHLAGRIEEMTGCEQAADGQFFIFDRRSHTVYAVAPSHDRMREIIQIGAERGRVLRPTAFDLADDGTFVVADAPGNRGRVQVFHVSGATLGGFTLAARESPLIVLDGQVMSGVGSLEYTGRSVLISQPENGALVTEYALDGSTIRTFGALRPTGQEHDPPVHLALNAGAVVVNPSGGYYYVFLAGRPMFRKYDEGGGLLFERHVEGRELDSYIRSLPTSWQRKTVAQGGELPVVRPAIRAAAADSAGNLWLALAAPYTYVYDAEGDKRRTVQFRAAGVVSPTSMAFTRKGQILIAPGCFLFPGSPPEQAGKRPARSLSPPRRARPRPGT
jgi:DNA-binding beta-propeller fold protein YncE